MQVYHKKFKLIGALEDKEGFPEYETIVLGFKGSIGDHWIRKEGWSVPG
jgi:hypothetical protein